MRYEVEWCAHPGQHSQRDSTLGGEINILNENFDFQHSVNSNDWAEYKEIP